MIDKYDKEILYCKKLGHRLEFKYCRSENGGLPCSQILNCWFQRLPIEEFVKSNYNKDDMTKIFKPKQSKMSTIYDLIKKAQDRNL